MSVSIGIGLAERGLLPTPLLRRGIRRLLARRLREPEIEGFRASLREGPIAHVPERANEQHYEVPAEFFELVLGPRLKYSCAYWPEGARTLEAAEEAMLDLTCERAGLADGQEILDLGCGWGSLSLHAARRFPGSRVLAVSNSAEQRRFLETRAPRNVEVVTADVNDFAPSRVFDRIVSVEMFEHLRNYALLFERLARWLRPRGKLFVHVFCHRRRAYPFAARGAADWMARHFFTGGLMPSLDLLPAFAGALRLEEQHEVPGGHYRRTAAAWRERLEARRADALRILARTYGEAEAPRRYRRWRIFFLACEELFGYRGGTEWFVAHYRFAKTAGEAGRSAP